MGAFSSTLRSTLRCGGILLLITGADGRIGDSRIVLKGLREGRRLTTVATANVASGYESTSTGGLLQLTAGTYTGEMSSTSSMSGGGVDIRKAISIACTATDHGCILDGENDHRVVRVQVGSGTAVSLTGLKITKGSSTFGAGVAIWSGSVTMTDCFISDNDSEYVS